MSKPAAPNKGEEARPPSVEDYVDLLHRHQQSTHKFLHQVANNGKEVVSWWREYVHMAAAQFRAQENAPPSEAVTSNSSPARSIYTTLHESFTALSDSKKQSVKSELDAHSTYLTRLHSASAARISAVIKRTNATPYGPGAYLARWQNLLDSTPITPATAHGPVRKGASKSVKEEGRKDMEGNDAGVVSQDEVDKVLDDTLPDAPKVDNVLSLFGKRFRWALAGG